MKKFFILFLMLFVTQIVNAEILEAGISVDHVPKALYGSWRVNAKLDRTNSYQTFKPQSIDFWELSRIEDVITLNNQMSGAKADISVKTVEGNLVVFSRKSNYDRNKVLTDTVHLRLDGNKFSGINTLTLETFSLIDNHLMKTETAQYIINGEKIAGESILEE